MKKILTTIGALTITVAPIMTTISCFGTKEQIKKPDASIPEAEVEAAKAFKPLSASVIDNNWKVSEAGSDAINEFFETFYDDLFLMNSYVLDEMLAKEKTKYDNDGLRAFKMGKEIFMSGDATGLKAGMHYKLSFANDKLTEMDIRSSFSATEDGETATIGGDAIIKENEFKGISASSFGPNETQSDGTIFYGKVHGVANDTYLIVTTVKEINAEITHMIVHKQTGDVLISSSSTYNENVVAIPGATSTSTSEGIFNELYKQVNSYSHDKQSFSYTDGATNATISKKIKDMTTAEIIRGFITSKRSLSLANNNHIKYMKEDVEAAFK